MMLVDSLKDPVPSDRCTSQGQIHVAVATYVVFVAPVQAERIQSTVMSFGQN